MKKYRSILLVALLIATVSCKEKGSASTILAITKADGIQIVNAFNDAMVNPTAQLLEDLCANELSYGHSNGLIQDKATFIDDLVNGPYNFKSVTSPELSIEISEETIVARFIFLAHAIKDENPIDIRLGCIQIFQRNAAGKWKLLARQAYKLPEPKN